MKFRMELNRDNKSVPLFTMMQDMVVHSQPDDQDTTPHVSLSIPSEVRDRIEELKTEYEEKVIAHACQLMRSAGCTNVEILRHADGRVTLKGSG